MCPYDLKFHTVFYYHLDDTIINQVEVQRDLGLMISGDLTWSCHYKSIATKAYKILGLLHCRFAHFHSVNVKSSLYTTLIMLTAVILSSDMATLFY